eukprot:365756-Chlamydomonas_euryale.AAC.27
MHLQVRVRTVAMRPARSSSFASRAVAGEVPATLFQARPDTLRSTASPLPSKTKHFSKGQPTRGKGHSSASTVHSGVTGFAVRWGAGLRAGVPLPRPRAGRGARRAASPTVWHLAPRLTRNRFLCAHGACAAPRRAWPDGRALLRELLRANDSFECR